MIRKGILPTKEQWRRWSFPSKLGVISAYLGILGLVLSIGFYIYPKVPGTDFVLPSLPGNTGWLLLGTFDEQEQIYVRGPWYKVVRSKYRKRSAFPRKGEVIELIAERNVIIADYKTSGISKWEQPPWQENILEDDDYTGIKLKEGSIVEIRDISMGHFPNMPVVVWARIGYLPRTN